MRLTEIAFVLGVESGDFVDIDEGSIREFDRWDEFAASVRSSLRGEVSVTVRESPPESLDGLLVVCEESMIDEIANRLAIDADRVCPHVFMLNMKRGPREADRIGRLGVAGAILATRYVMWLTERDDDFGSGVFGLRDVADIIGAHCADSEYLATPQYCLIGAEDRYHSLPELLAAYLMGYAEITDPSFQD
ncbi:MAG: hypothetical protein ACRDTC_06785 [Pseudonocardiaceae bacterium]